MRSGGEFRAGLFVVGRGSVFGMRIKLSVFGMILLAGVVGGCADSNPPVPAAACQSEDCRFTDPWQDGPYPVGVRNSLVFDTTRQALAWDGCDRGFDCPRPIPISIWYPAVDAAVSKPQINFNSFFSVTEAEVQEIITDLVEDLGGGDVPDISIPDKVVESRLNVELRPGRWPLVVFSHGAGGVRFQSLFLTEFLASHGFIVISPDHEGDATISEIEGQIVTAAREHFEGSALMRPQDVMFLIDQMTAWDVDPDHWLNGAVAIELGVGLTGHSFGAYTSITVSEIDDRIAATVPQAAPGLSMFNDQVPTMFMIATEDDTIDEIGNDVMRAQYDLAPVPKAKFELLDAGHFTYSNMCDLFSDFGDGCGTGERITNGEPLTYVDSEAAFDVINGYTTAWFGAWIKGNPQYFEALEFRPDDSTVRYTIELYR